MDAWEFWGVFYTSFVLEHNRGELCIYHSPATQSQTNHMTWPKPVSRPEAATKQKNTVEELKNKTPVKTTNERRGVQLKQEGTNHCIMFIFT